MNAQELDRLRRDSIIAQLRMEYRADAEKFRAYLPAVAAMLDAMNPLPRPSEPPFELTEHEQTHHREALTKMLQGLDGGSMSSKQAVKALEHCANLILDGSLLADVKHETRVQLIKAVLGKSPESFTKDTTILIVDDASETPIANKASIVRGVYLELDKEMRLISISISPEKVKEFHWLMGIVGIGRDIDGKRDVSIRHDDYLAEIDPHGRF